MSGKVFHHLKSFSHDVAFYFFDYRDRNKTNISFFLLSIIRQMAHLHAEVMQTVLEVCDQDEQLCNANYRTIWRKLFVEGIFRIKYSRLQYWVIDALDECKSGPDLVALLVKLTETCSTRILLTSRDRFESFKQPLHAPR